MKLIKPTAALRAVTLALTLVLGTAGCAIFGDTGLTTKVKTAIFNEPELKVMDIGVSTEDSVVTLSGTVKSRAERAKAIAVARKVEGVKAVKSELVVKQ